MTPYILPAILIFFIIILVACVVQVLISTDDEIKDPEYLDPAELVRHFKDKAKKRGE